MNIYIYNNNNNNNNNIYIYIYIYIIIIFMVIMLNRIAFHQQVSVVCGSPNPKMAASDGNHDYFFKLILLGESGVGKTCMLSTFTEGIFSPNFITTIGKLMLFLSPHDTHGTRVKGALFAPEALPCLKLT